MRKLFIKYNVLIILLVAVLVAAFFWWKQKDTNSASNENDTATDDSKQSVNDATTVISNNNSGSGFVSVPDKEYVKVVEKEDTQTGAEKTEPTGQETVSETATSLKKQIDSTNIVDVLMHADAETARVEVLKEVQQPVVFSAKTLTALVEKNVTDIPLERTAVVTKAILKTKGVI